MTVETVESLGICSHIMAENYLLTVVMVFCQEVGLGISVRSGVSITKFRSNSLAWTEPQ